MSEADVQAEDFDVLPEEGSVGGWTNGQIACNIHTGKITAFIKPETAQDLPDLCYCEICYMGFTKSNQTVCCGHSICSRCLASYVKREFMGSRRCPWCREEEFDIMANRSITDQECYQCPKERKKRIHNENEGLEDELVHFLATFNGDTRPRLSDEQRRLVIDFYHLQISFDEILQNLFPNTSV